MILFEYTNGELELFGSGEEADISYWFKRRMEKAGMTAQKIYVFEPTMIDVDALLRQYRSECLRRETAAADEKDRREYERLKEKFGERT